MDLPLALVLRYVLATALIAAGTPKFHNSSAFVQGVIQYDVLPAGLARWYGRLLPLFEVSTGVFLFLGVEIHASAALSAAILLSFAVAVSVNIARGRRIPCFCFGTDPSRELGWQTLTRILILLSLAVILLKLPATKPLWKLILSPGTVNAGIMIPVTLLTAWGLTMLTMVEVSPLVIRAWTATAARPGLNLISAVWRRTTQPIGGTERRR